ncbi:MAG: RNB domain-containing ribonuclease [Actinomycetes bacterium]
MPARKLDLPQTAPPEVAVALAAVRHRLEVPEQFPPEVEQAAAEAARTVRLPAVDRTDLELITIDPPGSRDLDQALHISREPDGFTVSYAIADVTAFVPPGGPVDLEARRRGMTLYGPDRRIPLHPAVLSEGAASLLPGKPRAAVLWTLGLNDRGQMESVEVQRARVCSRAQLSYEEAQAELDGGSPRSTLSLLAEVGRWREQREIDRGGVSLQIPEQQVDTTTTPWSLRFRAPLAVEGWNAQISLLTGMAAAHLMLYGQVGVLRTMPPAEPGALRRVHAVARALGVPWPAELEYPDFVRSLDPHRPDHAAMLNACTATFRGAGYSAFSGTIPGLAVHAALAIDYAHVTAPLRRRVDRYASEICLALCADSAVPGWVLAALDGLPEEMAAAERRAKAYERAVLDLMEVFLLRERVGEEFSGAILEVERGRDRGTVLVTEPAVEGQVTGRDLPLGQQTRVRLRSADPDRGRVEFVLA